MIADRAYDTDTVPGLIAEAGGVAVIPSKPDRKKPRQLDQETYAMRYALRSLAKQKIESTA